MRVTAVPHRPAALVAAFLEDAEARQLSEHIVGVARDPLIHHGMIDRGAKRFADRPRRRCSAEEGRRAVEAWLRKHDITIDGVRLHKPPAHVYVDGRAVRFRGNWDDVLDEIRQFRK